MGNATPTETLIEGSTTGCSVVISDQTEHLPVISYSPSMENYQEGLTVYNATLLNKCALVKFNVTTSSETATCILDMNNKVTVDFETNGFIYSKENAGNIALAAGNGERWAILLPQEAVTGVKTHSYDGNYFGIGGAIPNIAENNYLGTGIELSVTSIRESVDLGLSSGLLWATYNVGADSPEDFGYYFAWGENQPKSYYSWDTYQFGNGEQPIDKVL